MSKAFTRETDNDDEEGGSPGLQLPQGVKNYISPGGHARLKAELDNLLRVERPHVVEIVAWAASNGDRSATGSSRAPAACIPVRSDGFRCRAPVTCPS